jgi:large subunit ribosomal protein L17
MRHQNAGRKFGRNTSHRRAMFRNLAANLITHERIETTDQKAKELRRIAERLLTKAMRLGEVAFTKADELKPADKSRRLHAQRLVGSYLPRFGVRMVGGEPKKIDLVEKLFCELAKRFQGRHGGYTRIVKLGMRRGDGASMSIIEFLGASNGEPVKVEAEDKEPKKKGAAKKPSAKAAAKPKKATAAVPAGGGTKAG